MEWQYELNAIDDAAARLWDEIKDQQLIVFIGEMGAGKTTLIQALGVHLGVKEKMSSPSFSIINEYISDAGTIYHIDLYRCRSEEEAIRAGVEDCVYSGSLCFVEWPSKAPGIFPEITRSVCIEAVDESTRKIGINDVSVEELKVLSRL